MRLTEAQVKQTILHHDRDVREAAVYYFARSYIADSSIVPLAIQVIEQYGFEDAFETYTFLQDLPHSAETILWLIQQVKKHGQPEEEFGFVHAIRSALMHADAKLLEQHADVMLQLDELDEQAKDTIGLRIRLASQSPNDLWRQLDEFCRRSDKLEEVPDDLALADHLVEALGRHCEFSVAKVQTILTGTPANNWTELCAVRLAGELRLQDAISAIVALHEEPDDWIFEEGHRALAKIGGDSVVEEFARRYPTGSSDLRSSAVSILENIHSDLSVQTCLRLFETEEDYRIRCSLLQSVLMNFSTEGIEPARQLILATPLDPEVLEVRHDLLTSCKLIGERFPEFDAWAEDAKHDTEFRKNWYRKHPLLPTLDEFELGGEELDEPSPESIGQHAHVGRNDPCPCGSGKKFKKCCLNKEESLSEQNSPPAAAKQPQYPVGTVALYGPDDRVTTKIVAAVIRRPGAEPVLERWMGTNIAQSSKVRRQIKELFDRHGVKSVAATERNMGCPHEEGQDFPDGEDCPFCPYWAGKQGSNRRD
jgi:hypothetical protein